MRNWPWTAVWLLSAGAAFAQTQPVGSVTQIQGSASATRTAGPVNLAGNAPIFSDDLIETGANSKLLVEFTDGTKLTLGPNAEVLVDEFVFNPAGGANSAVLKVTTGAMRLAAGAIERVGGPQSINVTTPVASIGVRGTDFFIEMESGDHLSVALFSGIEVAVSNAAGETILRPGEGTDIWGSPGQEIAPSRALTWGVDRVNRALALVTLSPVNQRPLYYTQPVAPETDVAAAAMDGKFTS